MSEKDVIAGAREQAWEEYRANMFELDAMNNQAGRGLIPSYRDWHAGWDAHNGDAGILAAKAEQAEHDAQIADASIRDHAYPPDYGRTEKIAAAIRDQFKDPA